MAGTYKAIPPKGIPFQGFRSGEPKKIYAGDLIRYADDEGEEQFAIVIAAAS